MRRLLDAFINSSAHGGPNALLGEVSTPVYVLKSTAYAMQTLVGDAFIVSLGSHIYVVKALTGNVSQLYRLNLVWNGDKRIVPPILICFIASIGERRWRLSECKHMDD